ncbi:hypothetical protein KC951_01385 [Candidatus Saccharibacteria bacterium]|nr:hypothetical protein [Candidatus Saccharibacteria bacterium]
MDTKKQCAAILESFKIANKVKVNDIKNLKAHKSQLYALGPVYAFDYKDKHYYIVDDYSLGDDENQVKDILSEINHLLKGNIVKSPYHFTAEGSEHIVGLDGNQYYLWESPLLS